MAKAISASIQNLKRFFRKPWEITGPCAHPEYKSAVPAATEYRLQCPATAEKKACIPAAEPENVFNIAYYPRDQRRNRLPIRRTIIRNKDDALMLLMKEKYPADYPTVPIPTACEEDYNAVGGGYQK